MDHATIVNEGRQMRTAQCCHIAELPYRLT